MVCCGIIYIVNWCKIGLIFHHTRDISQKYKKEGKTIMKRVIAILLSVMMMVCVLASCGGGETSTTTNNETSGEAIGNEYTQSLGITADMFGDEKDVSLKVWGPEEYAQLLTEQCNEFSEIFKEKNITIEVVAQSEANATTQITNDPETAADVFGFASDQMQTLMAAKLLAAVPTGFAENIAKTDAEAAVAASMVGEELMAYPETGNGYYLVYDKRVVSDEQAGSLEEILAACKKAGKKFIMNCGDGYYACVFAFTGGVTINGLKEDGKTQIFNDYDEAEAVATLKAFSKLMHDYSGTFTSLDPTNVSSGLLNGTVAAGVDGSWNSDADKKALGDNLGAAKLPTINVNGEAKQMISMYGYKMIGVNAYSKAPRTAQILAYYLASETCQLERVEQLGWSPTNKVVAENEATTSNITIAALVAQGEHSVPQLNVAPTFWDPIANLGNKLYADETNPETYDFAKLLTETIKNITQR